MKVLDCTLRDGGYYNNWDFDPEVVTSYLQTMADASIDYVELGLRNFAKDTFLGAFAFTTEAYLKSLQLPEGPTYGVMVDAKTILESELSAKEAIDALFVPAKDSPISLVRVAAHFAEVENSGPIVTRLKELGYIVGYNLMQAGGKPNELISDKAKQVTEWGCVDVLYFADSLGNMDANEVERIISAIRLYWQGKLGIHTHNNMGKGLDNTLTARANGVEWLDSTITGMGRGAGNTQTENLLAVLEKEQTPYNNKPVYELVIRHFEPMQRQYGWGSNLLYFLGAQNDVHPTYIQNLLSNSHYGTDEIVGAIDYLSKLEGTTSYNGVVLDSALNFSNQTTPLSGSDKVSGLLDDQHILIIANGPSVQKHSVAIKQYITANKPRVISINIADHISEEYIDYYAISHNSKFLVDQQRYGQLTKPIILPKHRFTSDEMTSLASLNLIDYGLEVAGEEIVPNSSYASIPFDVTAAYVLAITKESNCKSISLVGFDGFDSTDIRQKEMLLIFDSYQKLEKSLPLIALTPTSYPLTKGSIYAPNL